MYNIKYLLHVWYNISCHQNACIPRPNSVSASSSLPIVLQQLTCITDCSGPFPVRTPDWLQNFLCRLFSSAFRLVFTIFFFFWLSIDDHRSSFVVPAGRVFESKYYRWSHWDVFVIILVKLTFGKDKMYCNISMLTLNNTTKLQLTTM